MWIDVKFFEDWNIHGVLHFFTFFPKCACYHHLLFSLLLDLDRFFLIRTENLPLVLPLEVSSFISSKKNENLNCFFRTQLKLQKFSPIFVILFANVFKMLKFSLLIAKTVCILVGRFLNYKNFFINWFMLVPATRRCEGFLPQRSISTRSFLSRFFLNQRIVRRFLVQCIYYFRDQFKSNHLYVLAYFFRWLRWPCNIWCFHLWDEELWFKLHKPQRTITLV